MWCGGFTANVRVFLYHHYCRTRRLRLTQECVDGDADAGDLQQCLGIYFQTVQSRTERRPGGSSGGEGPLLALRGAFHFPSRHMLD